MKNVFQPYYLLALLIGGSLLWYDAQQQQTASYFFGFAENLETEVNFNYPVIVKKIHVKEGQAVSEGDVLMQLQRVKPKETLPEEGYKIAELQAEYRAWQAEKEDEIELLQSRHRIEEQELDAKIRETERALAYKKSLFEDLETLQEVPVEFSTLQEDIQALQTEKTLRDSLYQQEANKLRREIQLGLRPYFSEIERLEAKRQFDESQLLIDIAIKAPFDGLVGNISCKEEEHLPSYKTLLTFYEPNPTLVKGYIHENLHMEVGLRDSFQVRSTTHPEQSCTGVITGLGSRIVEIPTRLRKINEVKTYGREVIISIPTNNPFIQKEKVALEFLPAH